MDRVYRDFFEILGNSFSGSKCLWAGLIGVVPGVWCVHSSPGAGGRPWTDSSTILGYTG